MRPTFLQTLRDETMRTELGAGVVAGLACENLMLSCDVSSAAVRRGVIERRV